MHTESTAYPWSTVTLGAEKKLVFGIYPGGVAGGDTGLLAGPPDAPTEVTTCLADRQGSALPFVVRCYDSFQDPNSPWGSSACAPQTTRDTRCPNHAPSTSSSNFAPPPATSRLS